MRFFLKDPPSSGQEAPESERLNRFSLLLPLNFVALIASLTYVANADPKKTCPQTRAGKHVAAQPEAWRSAVENLLASTRSPDQPWSCVGGEVDLQVRGESAILTVVDARGQSISREIITPEDVVPLGEALLAKPIVETEPVKPAVHPETKNPEPKPILPESERPAPRDPRLLAALTVGPRYAGPGEFLWGSFTVSAAIPFRPWGAGVWLRVDAFSTALDKPIPPTRDLCIGAAGYWSISRGRVELRPVVRPSLAVVTRQLAVNDGPTGPEAEPQQPRQPQFRADTQLDFRLGAQAQILIALKKQLRLVVGLDAEVSPEQLMTRYVIHRTDVSFGRLPVYTVGLDVGLEVAVP